MTNDGRILVGHTYRRNRLTAAQQAIPDAVYPHA
jgi:hypothetical protein